MVQEDLPHKFSETPTNELTMCSETLTNELPTFSLGKVDRVCEETRKATYVYVANY